MFPGEGRIQASPGQASPGPGSKKTKLNLYFHACARACALVRARGRRGTRGLAGEPSTMKTTSRPFQVGLFPTGRLTPKQEITSPTERLAPERNSLRTCLPNGKTYTQTANQKPKKNTCPRKETYDENVFPTEDWHPNRTGILAPERRLIMKMVSQQED